MEAFINSKQSQIIKPKICDTTIEIKLPLNSDEHIILSPVLLNSVENDNHLISNVETEGIYSNEKWSSMCYSRYR